MIPYDYSIQAADPMASLGQGAQLGLGLRQIQDARVQAEAQRQAQAQMNAELSAASQDMSKLPGVMVRYPQLAEKLKHGWDAMNANQQQTQLTQGGEVLSALAAGRPDVAANVLSGQAEAMRNSGDEKGAQLLEAMAKVAETAPDQLKTAIAMRMAAVPGGDKVIEGIAKLGAEQRAAEKAPAELEKAKADAQKAGSEATKSAVDAKYAEDTAKAALLKAAADLGLTKAQTTQAMALTRKYDAETKKTVAEAAGGDPTKVFAAENELRKEYANQTKGFVDVTESYRRIKASKPDAVGDLSTIFGYMKMLDPASTVREGEFASAQNTTGVPGRVLNMYNKVLAGERLTDSQRQSFKSQAGELYAAAAKREEEVRSGLTKVAKAYKLNPENIFAARSQESTAAPSAPVKVATDADYNALPSGAEYIAPDGSTRRKK